MEGGVRKRGNSWYYYFDLGNVNGKRKKIERKAIGAKSKKEAQAILRRAISEYENTGHLFEPSKTSLSDYMQFWLKEYVELNLSYNTYVNYEQVIKNHINPAIGKIRLSAVSPDLLQKFINKKHRDGFARKTLTIFHSVLNSAFKQAVYPYKLIKENPMQYIKLPRMERTNVTKDDLKIISLDQVQKILNHIGKNDIFYIPFQIGFNTGMRRGEVCGLTWDKVDLENGVIEVDKGMIYKNKEFILGPPKNNSSYRKIPIGSTLVDILKEHKLQQKKNKLKYGEYYYDSDFVCTKANGKFITLFSIKWSCEKIKKELGINFSFHSLRHTHATLLMERDAPLKDIQHRLGHARSSITIDTYAHLTKEMQNETMDIFESLTKGINS